MSTRYTLLLTIAILILIGFIGFLYYTHRPLGKSALNTPITRTATSTMAASTKTAPTQKAITLSYQLGDGAQITTTTDVDITGWHLTSAATGKSYTIPPVKIELGYKGSKPAVIPAENVALYQYDYTTVLIADGGDPREDYVHRTESTSYYLYTGPNFSFAGSDTLSLVDPSGVVRASITY